MGCAECEPPGTAATSGMVQVGDEIVKIDSQEVEPLRSGGGWDERMAVAGEGGCTSF